MAFINHCVPSLWLGSSGHCDCQVKWGETKWDVYLQSLPQREFNFCYFCSSCCNVSESVCALVCQGRLSDRLSRVGTTRAAVLLRPLLEQSRFFLIYCGFVSFQLAHWVDLSMDSEQSISVWSVQQEQAQEEELSFVWHLCSPGCVTQEATAKPPPLPFRSFAFYQSPHLLATWPIRFAFWTALQGTGHAMHRHVSLSFFTSLIAFSFALHSALDVISSPCYDDTFHYLVFSTVSYKFKIT